MPNALRTWAWIGAIAAVMLSPFLWQAVHAQGKTGEEDGTEEIRGRLPVNYNRLGLTEEQRTQIYRIQHDYESKIDELVAKIIALREQRDREIRETLTDLQRQQLALIEKQEELRRKEKEKEAAEKSQEKSEGELQTTKEGPADPQ